MYTTDFMWEGFAAEKLAEDLSPEMKARLRYIFFAGAGSMLKNFLEISERYDMDTSAELIEGLHRELNLNGIFMNEEEMENGGFQETQSPGLHG